MGLLDTNPDRYLPRDNGSLRTIDHVHQQIHAGAHFVATHKITHGATVPSSATMLITTPAASEYHMVLEVAADKGGYWTFEESASATSGTAITELNNDRQSSTTSDAIVTHTATLTATVGTVLEQHLVGAAGSHPASVTGGGAEARNEWILEASTAYLVRFVAAGATTTTVINAYWYER